MSTPAKHEIQTVSRGKGLEGFIQNQCSCGWKGKLHYAHNDYQFSNCSEERKEHVVKFIGPGE